MKVYFMPYEDEDHQALFCRKKYWDKNKVIEDGYSKGYDRLESAFEAIGVGKIYANIAESKKSKKIDVYFSIVANYCYQIDDSATKTFHAVIPNKYENVSWDEAMTEILNRLPRMHSSLPLEVAIGIVIDTCRKAEELEKEEMERE